MVCHGVRRHASWGVAKRLTESDSVACNAAARDNTSELLSKLRVVGCDDAGWTLDSELWTLDGQVGA